MLALKAETISTHGSDLMRESCELSAIQILQLAQQIQCYVQEMYYTQQTICNRIFFLLRNGSQSDEFNIFPGSLYLQTTHDIKVSPFTYLFCSLCLCEIGKIKECEIILIEDKKKEEKLRFAEVASCDFNLATEFASPKLIPWQLVFSFFSTQSSI